MATSSDSAVDLGFVEKSECWRLLSHFFPSKVGGKPAWLAFKPLPTIEDVSCGICGKPCILLLQVYAPVEDVTTCFHRTMFIFVCKDADCCRYNANNNFVVLRSQLCRDNEFYPNVPPEESCFDPKSDYPRAENFGSSLCAVCGSVGPKRCSRCKKASYCSKEHQTIDWKAGHKKCCAIDPSKHADHSSVLLPEYTLVMDTENYNMTKNQEKDEKEKMKDYDALMESTMADRTSNPKVDEDLEKMARQETEDDRIFRKFKERIAHEPEQVLRYDRGGLPLWVSSEGLPQSQDIPTCQCGATRIFEFQVMPQLLNHLQLDDLVKSIDWGTLAIFSCSANCNNPGYQKEFLWKQDFSDKDLNVQKDD